jgi:hypothetical protein
MNNLARNEKYEQPFMAYGRVIEEGNRVFEVEAEFGSIKAARAAGCLLRPGVGDEVLLSVDDSGRCYILSVLERASDSEEPSLLDFEGDVSLNVRQGGLAVHTDDDVSLVSGAGAMVSSEEVSVHARRGEVLIDGLSFIGRALDCQIGRIRTTARTMDQTVRTLTQRLKNAFRYVEEHEEVQTNTTRYVVDDLMAMHTKNTDLTSKEVVKVMAEQIHLG